MPTDNFPNTAWPTDVDAAQDRTDGVDFCVEEDFDYQDDQITTIEEWLGSTTTGRIIGSGIAGAGPSGLLSPIADGPGEAACRLIARAAFATGDLLSVGDDYDAAPPAYTEKFAIDADGRVWSADGFDADNGLLIPTDAAPAPTEARRLLWDSGTNELKFDDGGALHTIGSGGGGVRATPTVIIGSTAKGDTAGTDCDVLDADNGLALKTAIEAASAGDVVFIRPGTYDFNNPSGPSTPIAIPAGVRVVGAGQQLVTISPQLLNPRCFTMAALSVLEELKILMLDALIGSEVQAGTCDAVKHDASSTCIRVEVEYEAGWGTWNPANVVAGAAFRIPATATPGSRAELIQCAVSGGLASIAAGGGPTYRVLENLLGTGILEIHGCPIFGGDFALYSIGRIFVKSSSLISFGQQIIDLVGASESTIVGNHLEIFAPFGGGQVGILLNACERVSIVGNHITIGPGFLSSTTAVGLVNTSRGNVINSNKGPSYPGGGNGWATVVNIATAADDWNVVVGNCFMSVGAPGAGVYGNASGNSVVANNI